MRPGQPYGEPSWGGPDTLPVAKEEAMHPSIAQKLVAQRAAGLRKQAAAAARTRQARQARRAANGGR